MDLQTLVRQRLDHLEQVHDFEAKDAAALARKRKHPISEERLSQIRNTPPGVEWGPSRQPTILGIAAGLDLPVEEVSDAAWRAAGVPIPHRKYIRSRRDTKSAICTCEPTHSGRFDQLVLVLPPGVLTNEKLAQLVADFEKAGTQLMSRRTRSS